MSDLRSFPPVVGAHATRLILGSMPGAASLQAQQYYAHPRNAFWTIMESLLGIPCALPYPERTRALADTGIAVWDVLKACRRNGSLDSAIEADSIVANDFRRFLKQNPGINHIYFNGGAARRLYDRHVLPVLQESLQQHILTTLPSTSPANASYSLQKKIDAWRVIKLQATAP
jgi:double-stranded uracil-DNA glycosylase